MGAVSPVLLSAGEEEVGDGMGRGALDGPGAEVSCCLAAASNLRLTAFLLRVEGVLGAEGMSHTLSLGLPSASESSWKSASMVSSRENLAVVLLVMSAAGFLWSDVLFVSLFVLRTC